MIPVIVLKMGQTGLGVARSLGRLGIEVYGVDTENGIKGFFSKYCRKSFVFPDPVNRPDACLEKLLKLGNNLNEKAVLMPASDGYLSFISKFSPVLSDFFLFNIPAPPLLDQLINKTGQYRLAKVHGIPIPNTFSPDSLETLKAINHAVKYPVFIKGSDSTQWNHAFHCKGFIAHDFKGLKTYVSEALKRNIPPVVQEMIIGANRNHFKVCAYYSKDRELKALFSTHKARQFPVECGIGTFMRSTKMPALISLARFFFENTGFTGVGSIEFKKDDRDNCFKMIEINSRFWRQNAQATCAGVNFPYINYLDCIGKTPLPCLEFKENVCWMNTVPDMLSALENLKKKDTSFTQYIASVVKTDCFAYACKDDIKPVLKNFTGAAGRLFPRIHQKK